MVQLSETTLSNGLRVAVASNHKAPVVNVTVAYKVGSKDELPTHTGLAHLFEHLMFDNIQSDDGTKFDSYITSAGGESNAYTSYDHTLYHESLPIQQIEIGLWLEAQRMRSFVATQLALDTQINVVSEEILQVVKNRPYGNWRELQSSVAYSPECMYHWEVIGSHEHVRATTFADASAWYQRFYRPHNAVLVLSGDIDAAEAFSLAERYFGDIPTSGTQATIARTKFDATQRRHASVSDTQNVPFDAVFRSYHTDGFMDDRGLAGDLLSSILSDGQSSRLYRALLHDEQIASDVGCFHDKREYSSLLTLYAFSGSQDVGAELLHRKLQEQIDRLCRDGIREEELFKARNKIQTSLAYEMQSSGGVADIVAQQVLFWSDANRVNQLMRKYEAISAEDVVEYARQIFHHDNMVNVDILAAR